MKRVFTFPVIASGVAVSLMACSAWKLYPIWVAVLGFWFGSVALLYRRGTPEMSAPVRLWHQACVLLFPIGATLTKYRLYANDIGSDVGFGNRIQHFSWALCTVGLFAPMLLRWMSHRDVVQKLMIAVGFVSMLGNFNEIAEWRRGGMLYGDTMKDLVMNFGGALLGALIITVLDGASRAQLPAPRHMRARTSRT